MGIYHRSWPLWLIVAVFSVPFIAGCAQAQETSKGSVEGAKAQQLFSSDFPDVPIRSFAPAPLAGWYEVVVDNERIVYFNPEERVAMFGDLFRGQRNNLTQSRRAEMAAELLAKLPREAAVKIGNGPKVVYEVTDPDCSYCRRGSSYLDQRSDLTRYIFFYPLPSHPQAPAKVRFILAAADQQQAYHEVMKGVYDTDKGGKPVPEVTDNTKLEVHVEVAKRLGVRGTPAYWINGQAISGANIPALEQLLGPIPGGGEGR
ncbi:MAG: DsbC family protein [Desulfuromonadales bacterium]|nr:DsbC family protein [Desulfuromonadales bacterium]